MELRLLVTEEERRVFSERLAEARAELGIRFKEKSRSQLARIQLAFGNLYGLFERESDPADKMIAGISTHDLEMFPQTCPKPDLSYLAPGAVVECSDLWSLRKGAGLMVWCGMVIPLVGRGTRAALAYLAAGPESNLDFYLGTGFKTVDQPVLYPYVETIEGQPIHVQPMVLESEAFDRLAKVLSRFAKSMAPDHSRVQVKNFIGMRLSSEDEQQRDEMRQAAA